MIKFVYVCVLTFLSFIPYVKASLYFLPDYKYIDFADANIPHNPNTIENSCPEIGYNVTSCPEGQVPYDKCPLASGYYKSCKKICEGYEQSCPDGKVPDVSQYCSYDHSYIKCVCDECEGYDYTYIQATTGGYVVEGEGCQSCEELRYKRKENPCDGYDYDASNCGVTSCGTLSGNTCQSGTIVKYAECKSCPAPSCSSTEWNLDSYWCNGALRCWLPEK